MEANHVHQINALDYGVSPKSPNNLSSFQSILETCVKISQQHQKSIELTIPPGIYHISHPDAIQLRKDVMSGKFGHSPQAKMYYPYCPHVKALDFSGISNLTVFAEGAIVLCEGWMEILSLQNCNNILIHGLTLDYSPKPFSEGKVVNIGKTYFDVEVGSDFPISNGVPVPRIEFWDVKNNCLTKECIYVHRSTYLGNQLLRIHNRFPFTKNHYLALMIHTFHFRPAILMLNAQDITLNNVIIHSQPGMGIVGHLSHNLIFNHLHIKPSQDHHMSTNTDATHFTSCTGKLELNQCRIYGQGDDSLNVHVYYHAIYRHSEKNTYIMKYEDQLGTHAQVLDYPDKGDFLEIVERKTLRPIGETQVLDVQHFEKEWKNIVQLDKSLPRNLRKFFLVNVSKLPSVHIHDSHFGPHLARGLLIKSRNVIIENNIIEETTGTAIHVGAEANWLEGVPTKNLTIRNNRLINSCYKLGQTGTRDPGYMLKMGKSVKCKTGVIIERAMIPSIIKGC